MNSYDFTAYIGSTLDFGYGPRKIVSVRRLSRGSVFLLDAVPGFDRPEILVAAVVQGPHLGVQDWQQRKY